jgi:4a-hydroxytetrahydrobiopterin dehydratase
MKKTDRDLLPLGKEEVKKQIKTLKGWEYKDNKISKTFQFADFTNAVKFVDGLVNFCNKIDHHPDIFISYSKVKFELTRFDIGGKVTKRDLTVAKKIEENFSKE